MKLSLNQSELAACAAAVGSVVKAGTAKEKDMKPNSTDYKVLQVNRTILEKADYAFGVAEKEKRIFQDVEFNRQEAKVLIATMLLTSQLQARAQEEYSKRPDNHPSFKDEPGRTKADYVSRLEARIQEVNNVLNKIRKAL